MARTVQKSLEGIFDLGAAGLHCLELLVARRILTFVFHLLKFFLVAW